MNLAKRLLSWSPARTDLEVQAAKEIKRLQAIVDKLSTTVDGVPITPRMTLWVIYNGEPLAVVVEAVGYSIDLEDNPWGSGTVAPHEWFYSTREAAEAAGGK